MSGRSGSRPTMSLLAFQDIITSVSGILMFIVLMLSLELSNESAAPASVVDPAAEAARLEAALASARRDLAGLEKDLAGNDDMAHAAAAVVPEEVRTEIGQLDQRIISLQAVIAALESRRDSLLAEKQTAERRDSASTQAERGATQKALARAAQLAKEVSDLATDERPVFSLPRGFNKSGWLVVISGDRCEVAPLGRRANPRSFAITTGFLAGEPDVSPFLTWSRSLGPDQYFLLITRPSGVRVFEAIQRHFEMDGVAHGFDLASPARKLLDAEKGAHQ